MRPFLLLLLVALSVLSARAQLFDAGTLSGKYHFVHLLISTGNNGRADNARNLGGTITFDGVGGYTYQGLLGTGDDAALAAEGAGTYAVDTNAFAILTNPIENNLEVNARIGAGAEIVLGSSTETADGSYDLFVAVRAPTSAVSNATVNGNYALSTLMLPDGSDDGITTAFALLTADGQGSFPAADVIGHSALFDDVNFTENLPNVTYGVNADGSGALSLGADADLLAGDRDIFVSAMGNYLIGFSTAEGERDILLGVKNPEVSVDDSSWEGTYWIAELVIERGIDSQGLVNSYTSAAGGIRANGEGSGVLSQRQRFDLFPLDFGALQAYRIDSDGSGHLAAFQDSFVTNMALGPSAGGVPPAFLGAQVLAETDLSVLHGVFFGVRMPDPTGGGVFLSPLGVVNAASLAPPTFPVSGGTIVSLFGGGLAPGEELNEIIPLPTSLLGVSVLVDNVPAPLLFVNDRQINLQIPFGVSGNSAEIVVNNNGVNSNSVRVPVAATSPSIFSTQQTGFGPGAITHPDFRPVTAADPAEPGETVVIFLTGLGALDPPIPDGAPGPGAEPFARAIDPNLQVLFGGEVGEIEFAGAVPGFAGLYQVNVTIPSPVIAGEAIPVAVFTTNAFACFTDISIGF